MKPSPSRRRLRRGGPALAGVLVAATARAGGPLGHDGEPIRTSHYGVDLTQGPVLASSRVTGLAGAYVAIAEGVDGNTQNPVAPAVRPAHSIDHFDYDWALGLTLPATLTSTDFFNTGRGRTQLSDARQEGFVFVNPAVNLVWGTFGLGAIVEFQNYALRRSDSRDEARNDRVAASVTVTHVQAARVFSRGEIAVGAGARITSLSVTNPSAPSNERDLFSTAGAGVEAGALYTPHAMPFRVGAAFRSAVSTDADPQSRLTPNAQGDRVIGDPANPVNAFWLPNRIETPWDLSLGLALQVGPRPLNPRFIDPNEAKEERERVFGERSDARARRREEQRERLRKAGRLGESSMDAIDAELDSERAVDELHLVQAEKDTREDLERRAAEWPRRYVLVSMSLLVVGPASDAVGIESFLQRTVARSGERPTFSPRLGLETEMVPHWLKIRAGTYGEPSRFATSANRLHGTFGFEAKLFPWTVFGVFDDGTEWKVSTSLDAARRYLGWGVSIGIWH